MIAVCYSLHFEGSGCTESYKTTSNKCSEVFLFFFIHQHEFGGGGGGGGGCVNILRILF